MLRTAERTQGMHPTEENIRMTLFVWRKNKKTKSFGEVAKLKPIYYTIHLHLSQNLNFLCFFCFLWPSYSTVLMNFWPKTTQLIDDNLLSPNSFINRFSYFYISFFFGFLMRQLCNSNLCRFSNFTFWFLWSIFHHFYFSFPVSRNQWL